MTSSLSIARIIAVSVSLTAAAAQAQSLKDLLVLGTSTVIDPVERSRLYSSLTAVATDFGTAAPEYYAAQRWFGQTPQPTRLYIGRWINAAASGGLRGGVVSAANQAIGVWNAISAGSLAITKDGTGPTNVTGLNFSAAGNMNAVAAIIQAGLTGVTCVWNASYNRFELQSNTTGATSAVAFLTAAGTGTDITTLMSARSTGGGYVYAGQALETAATAATYFDANLGQQWYSLVIPSGAVTADHLAVAGFIEATTSKHVYAITTQDSATLSSASTTDVAYLIQQLGYKRTLTQYSSSDAYAVISAFARILTVDYNGSNTTITLKFKQEPGVAPETLNVSQVTALEAKNCNVFVSYNNGTNILEQGVMGSGDFADTVFGTDWLAVTVQTALYNLLYSSTTKIPQTDQGVQILTTQCDAICAQAVTNGLLAPGQWNNAGFGTLQQGDFLAKGYYIYAPKVSSQLQSDRVARIASPIQIAAKLAGAIHSASVAITVNQ
jgi:hypothetical protein